jgi:glycine/D-amino acid oxidase-like deaminating enzyme
MANPAALRERLLRLFDDSSAFGWRLRPSRLPWRIRFALASSSARVRSAFLVMRHIITRSNALNEEYAASGFETTWTGLRPCTPDGLPVLGGPTGTTNLILATGHAIKGLALARISGRLVAELACGAAPSVDSRRSGPTASLRSGADSLGAEVGLPIETVRG